MLLFLLAMTSEDVHDKIILIYENYHKDMLKYAKGLMQKTSGAYDAEDAVQNAYLSIQTYIHNIDFWNDDVRLRRYVLTVVRYEVIKLVKNAVYCEDIDSYVNVLVSDADLVRAVNEMEDYQELVELIRQMKEQYAALMYMRWVEDMTVGEIAERLEMKRATVYKNLERGKLMLMKLLAERGYDGAIGYDKIKAGAD